MGERSLLQNQTTPSPGDPPEIILRIPGPWKTARALSESLPDGFEVREGRLVLPDASSVQLGFLKPDRKFADVFTGACRGGVSRETRVAVARYAASACLVGPAGSLDRVRRMMTAGVAMLDTGGHGVFLDTSALAHDGHSWRELTSSGDPYAPLTAFVTIVRHSGELTSIGMHVFGLRDAVVSAPSGWSPDEGEDLASELLQHFLGYLLATGGDMTDGALFGTGSAEATVREAPPLEIVARTVPAFNPYGRWRIEAWSPGRRSGPCLA